MLVKGVGAKEDKMRYSVVKVSKTYQDVRAICRKHPECKSLDEAKIFQDTDGNPHWDLTAKENRALQRMCVYLGI